MRPVHIHILPELKEKQDLYPEFFFFNWIHDVIHFSLVNSPSILNELKNGKIQAIFP